MDRTNARSPQDISGLTSLVNSELTNAITHGTADVERKGRLLWVKNAQGVAGLHVTTKSASLLSRITGKRARQRNLAKEEVKKIFVDHIDKILETKQLNNLDTGNLEDLRKVIEHCFDDISRRKALTIGQLQPLSKAVAGAVKVYGARSSVAPKQVVHEWTDSKSVTSSKVSDGSGQDVSAERGSGSETSSKVSVDPDSSDSLGEHATWSSEESAASEKETFKSGSRQYSLAKKFDLEEQTYSPVKLLAEGGEAAAFLIKDENNGKQFVLKCVKDNDNPEEKKYLERALGHEGITHQSVSTKTSINGCAHPNVLEYKGVAPDGLVLEYAPYGSVGSLQQGLKLALEGRRITKEQAYAVRMTAFRDMACGVAAVNKHALHCDLNATNFYIGEDRNVKVADFGRARLLTPDDQKLPIGSIRTTDNPYGNAPEVLYAKEAYEESRILKLNKNIKTDVGEYTKTLARFTGMSAKSKAILAKHALLPQIAEAHPEDHIDAKSDAFALGATAVGLFTGKLILDRLENGYNVIDALKKFGRDGNNKAVAKKGGLTQSTGDNEVDTLLDGLMNPKPEKRLSASDAVKRIDELKAGGVGTAQTRGLMIALAQASPELIGLAEAVANHNKVIKNNNNNNVRKAEIALKSAQLALENLTSAQLALENKLLEVKLDEAKLAFDNNVEEAKSASDATSRRRATLSSASAPKSDGLRGGPSAVQRSSNSVSDSERSGRTLPDGVESDSVEEESSEAALGEDLSGSGSWTQV